MLDPFDRVAEEFVERCRRGESPSIAEYEARFPEHARKDSRTAPLGRHDGTAQAAGPFGEGIRNPSGPNRFPDRLGEYRIIRELGRGGMGIVYEAVQESLGRHVALKVIPRHGVLDAKRRQRFQREAQAVAKLHHTNIVPIFAVGEHDGLPYYAMQYIRGKRARSTPRDLADRGESRRDEATGGSSHGSASRPRRPSSTPTTRGSSTATSSRRTC